MDEHTPGGGHRTAPQHWVRQLPFLLLGIGLVLLGANQLAAPDDCLHGYKLSALLTEWLCRSLGGIASGVLLIVIGLVVVFVIFVRR